MPESIVWLLVSACLGAAVGLIRQWSQQQEHEGEGEFAGLRTFTLLGVLGHVAGVVSDANLPAVFPVALGVLGLYLAASQLRRGNEGHLGHTTFAASMLTFISGGLVHYGRVQLAVVVAAATMVLLGVKAPLHAWTRRFTAQDIRSALLFAAVSGVALPVFPDRGYGPFEAFNPHSIWLMVVLISGLGFVGYILMRLLGTSAGIAVTGLVGGLASSTATTLAFSRRSREEPGLGRACALAVLLACTVMLVRVVVLLGAVSPGLLARSWLGLALMAIPGAAFAIYLFVRRTGEAEKLDTPAVSNPLNLGMAVRFALLYGAVVFLVKVAEHWRIEGGLLAVSFLAGLTDMDAIALSVGNQANAGAVGLPLAAQAVVVGATANTLVKGAAAVVLGGGPYRRIMAAALGMTALAGVAAILVVGRG